MIPVHDPRKDSLLAFILLVVAAWASPVAADAPANELFRKLPSNASVVVALEDLRGHSAEILASPVAAKFMKLPAVLAFQGSDAARQLEVARTQIETVLDVKWTEIRDKIFGDAVVLCLHAPSEQALDEAQGLLLIKPSDLNLLKKMIRVVNALQQSQGELDSVASVSYRGVEVSVRKLKGKSSRLDYYVILPDGIFGWSNSESLIHAIIDRSLPGGSDKSLAESAEFQELRKGLPGRSFLSLVISPGLLSRLVAMAPQPKTEQDQRTTAAVQRLLKSMVAFGLALEWRNGPMLHSHEVLDPKLAEVWVKDWAKRASKVDGLVSKLPRQSLGFVTGSVDFVSAYQGIRSLLVDDEMARLSLVETTMQGLFLGNNTVGQILPALGPGVITYVEPGSGAEGLKLELIGAIELAAGRGNELVARSLENAVRTILALYALDPKHQALPLKVETIEQGGRRITKVTGGPTPFVFSLAPEFFVIGTSAEAVARFGEGGGADEVKSLRQTYFPDAAWYGVVDLSRFAELARTHKNSLAKQLHDAKDLDQAIALLDLFPTALVAMTIDPDFRSVHRVVGLVAAAADR